MVYIKVTDDCGVLIEYNTSSKQNKKVIIDLLIDANEFYIHKILMIYTSVLLYTWNNHFMLWKN